MEFLIRYTKEGSFFEMTSGWFNSFQFGIVKALIDDFKLIEVHDSTGHLIDNDTISQKGWREKYL